MAKAKEGMFGILDSLPHSESVYKHKKKHPVHRRESFTII